MKSTSSVGDSPAMNFSSLRLEGKQAKSTHNIPVGGKIKMTVTGIKKSHSMDEMGHTARFDIKKASYSKKLIKNRYGISNLKQKVK